MGAYLSTVKRSTLACLCTMRPLTGRPQA